MSQQLGSSRAKVKMPSRERASPSFVIDVQETKKLLLNSDRYADQASSLFIKGQPTFSLTQDELDEICVEPIVLLVANSLNNNAD